ncbi:MAG TPA: GFA family protein [Candidatus Binataceae bacterium]|nr:GFA family protein [Candidatus Binataceae bacterium]
MSNKSMTGGCACGAIRYTIVESPMIVHACHCRDCQRITGSAFVINLWIERKFVEAKDQPKSFRLTAGTGKPHDVFFCEKCGTYLWSYYHAAPGALFVRAGTLDHPEKIKPDVHIFTRSKVPWLQLPSDVPSFETFYKIDEVWPASSKERLRRNTAEAR